MCVVISGHKLARRPGCWGRSPAAHITTLAGAFKALVTLTGSVHVFAHVPQHPCGNQRAFKGQFSPFITWAQRLNSDPRTWQRVPVWTEESSCQASCNEFHSKIKNCTYEIKGTNNDLLIKMHQKNHLNVALKMLY